MQNSRGSVRVLMELFLKIDILSNRGVWIISGKAQCWSEGFPNLRVRHFSALVNQRPLKAFSRPCSPTPSHGLFFRLRALKKTVWNQYKFNWSVLAKCIGFPFFSKKKKREIFLVKKIILIKTALEKKTFWK